MRKKSRELTWEGLLKLCLEHGKEKVLAVLEQQNRSLEGLQVSLYADPETVRQAQNLTETITRQCITIGRLRRMSDDEIRAAVRP